MSARCTSLLAPDVGELHQLTVSYAILGACSWICKAGVVIINGVPPLIVELSIYFIMGRMQEETLNTQHFQVGSNSQELVQGDLHIGVSKTESWKARNQLYLPSFTTY